MGAVVRGNPIIVFVLMNIAGEDVVVRIEGV